MVGWREHEPPAYELIGPLVLAINRDTANPIGCRFESPEVRIATLNLRPLSPALADGPVPVTIGSDWGRLSKTLSATSTYEFMLLSQFVVQKLKLKSSPK